MSSFIILPISPGSQQVHGELRASLEMREDEIRALREEKQQLEDLHSNLKQEIQV